MGDPLEPTWRQLVAEGRIERAMARYLAQLESGATRDAEVWRILTELEALQSALREGAYARARRLLASIELTTDSPADPTADPVAGLLDWTALAEQLELLVTAAEALKLEPDHAIATLDGVRQPLLLAEAETLRGTAHIYLGDHDAARTAFDVALTLDPKQYRAQTNLGNLALEAGRVDEAIALYERALLINPEFANAHHNLGVAYRRKGQIGKSVSSLRKAQRAAERKMRAEARETLRGGVKRGLGRYGRWLFYAAVAVAAYLVLRAVGMV